MNRPLVPSFLKNFDKKLLLHKPNTWSIRTHFVIWYSILFMAVLALICFVSPSDPRARSVVFEWISFVSLVSFIGLVVWLIYLLRFNVFKRFGVQKWGDGLLTFFLIFCSVFFIVLPTYVPPAIESWKANRAFTSDEIVNDVNSMNEKLCQLNYTILPKEWYFDTLELKKNNIVYEQSAAYTNGTVRKNYSYISPEGLERKILRLDSLVKISDSVYISYDCPGYTFIHSDDAMLHSKVALKSSEDIYFSVIQKFKPIDTRKTEAELNILLKKYKPHYYFDEQLNSDDAYNDSALKLLNSYNLEQRILERHNAQGLSHAIMNICQKKYQWELSNLSAYVRIIFYISLVLSLLIFIFRHTTIKTFFLSALTAMVLCILSALLIVSTIRNNEEEAIFGFVLFYYALFFVLMLIIFSIKKRGILSGISLNLVTLFTSFIPLFIVTLYYTHLLNMTDVFDKEYHEKIKNKDTHYAIAEIAGVLIFLLLLETLFKKLYRKWYALPEN